MASVELFESWLHKGLGRAVTCIAQNGDAPYRDAILHACAHKVGYDTQCEDRNEYLWMLIQHSLDPNFYRDAILQHLEHASCDCKLDWPQLFYLAQQFAQTGDSIVRHAMYSAFDRLGFSEAGESSATALINLDGWEGFAFAINRFNISTGEKDWPIVGLLLDDLQDRTGKREAERSIANAWTTHPSVANVIAAYRLHEEEQRQTGEREISERVDLQALESMTSGASWAVKFRMFALRASPEELAIAANRFLRDEDPRKTLSCLRFFASRIFPGDLHKLLELSDSADPRVMGAATRALSNIKHPLVRARALLLLWSTERFADGLVMLESNYESLDLPILNDAMNRASTPDDIHHLGFVTRGIAGNQVHPELESLLLQLYEAGPCSLCRTKFVQALIQLGRLPESIRNECRFDAEADTRELVRAPQPS